MKKLIIEWKHYVKKGNTCDRCTKTGASIKQVINDLKDNLETKGIGILYKETKLSEAEIEQSNIILINGTPLEDLLEDTKKVETKCKSCCNLIGANVSCRALDCCGQVTEDIPPELIKKAIENFLRKEGL